MAKKNAVQNEPSEGFWTLCWTDVNGNDRWARLKTPDEVANLLIEIVHEYNENADKYREEHYGVMDFEGEWLLFSPEADDRLIKLEDVPCYCSNEWVANNSDPVLS